ncbi:MAG: hypothetical protein WC935_01400 [Thermoleophilia bacterium]
MHGLKENTSGTLFNMAIERCGGEPGTGQSPQTGGSYLASPGPSLTSGQVGSRKQFDYRFDEGITIELEVSIDSKEEIR